MKASCSLHQPASHLGQAVPRGHAGRSPWLRLSAFSVFDVTAEQPSDQALTKPLRERLTRLAHFFKVGAQEFIRQFHDLRPLAQVAKQSQNLTNQAAWRVAVTRVSARASIAAAHPTNALTPALEAWAGWSFSTSGVEQNSAPFVPRRSRLRPCVQRR